MKKTIFDPRYEALIAILTRARKRRRLSQATVAGTLGVSRTWVSKTETKERRLDVLELMRLCQVYRISAPDLVSMLQQEMASVV